MQTGNWAGRQWERHRSLTFRVLGRSPTAQFWCYTPDSHVWGSLLLGFTWKTDGHDSPMRNRHQRTGTPYENLSVEREKLLGTGWASADPSPFSPLAWCFSGGTSVPAISPLFSLPLPPLMNQHHLNCFTAACVYFTHTLTLPFLLPPMHRHTHTLAGAWLACPLCLTASSGRALDSGRKPRSRAVFRALKRFNCTFTIF